MHKIIFLALIFILVITIFFRGFFRIPSKYISTSSIIPSDTKLTSPVFLNNSDIPSKYTCDGQNVNPPLIFTDVPKEAKSLVLLVDDPDAVPAGRQAPMGTWDHWVVFNIPPTVQKIDENTVPQGVEAMTSFGKPGYGGPCPPLGVHHYHFKLYALDTLLSLDQSAKKSDVEQSMQGHIIAQTELVGLYHRQ